jgi:dihydrofolate reductase|tara:strand:- start:194114 stop:194623 length:510 start_codon:yes stop_codon:yes gene_type:complete
MGICSLIAAVASNGVIGKDNDLIWYIPEDLKYFKHTTSGKPVVMGRKTFESIVDRIGKPLPNRRNVVITRQSDYDSLGADVACDIKSGLSTAKQHTDGEFFILGGAQIYAETINLCDRLYITEIHQEYQGDSHFPAINKDIWQETSRKKQNGDASKDIPNYSFVIYERI